MNELQLKQPASHTTWTDQLAFATAAREKLRQEHNEMGRKYREGLIDRATWEAYRERFEAKNLAVSKSLGKLRIANLPADQLAAVDTERDFELVQEATPDGV